MGREIFDIEMELISKEKYSNTLMLAHYKPVDTTISLPQFKPGQFVQVWIKGCDGVMLRRPISIYDGNEQSLSLLIQDAGRGTHMLLDVPIGSRNKMLLPLGNSFTLPPHDSRPLLIGGGVGIAPLFALGKSLKNRDILPTFLLGARSHNSFPDLTCFERFGTLLITTEDGSRGERGYVTQHSYLAEGQYTHIYMCGPTPMMKAVARWSKMMKIPAQASLENRMACGIGVCLCCVEPTIVGHKTVCHDGPVFDVNDLLWE